MVPFFARSGEQLPLGASLVLLRPWPGEVPATRTMDGRSERRKLHLGPCKFQLLAAHTGSTDRVQGVTDFRPAELGRQPAPLTRRRAKLSRRR